MTVRTHSYAEDAWVISEDVNWYSDISGEFQMLNFRCEQLLAHVDPNELEVSSFSAEFHKPMKQATEISADLDLWFKRIAMEQTEVIMGRDILMVVDKIYRVLKFIEVAQKIVEDMNAQAGGMPLLHAFPMPAENVFEGARNRGTHLLEVFQDKNRYVNGGGKYA